MPCVPLQKSLFNHTPPAYTDNLLTSGNWYMCLQPPSTDDFQGKLHKTCLDLFEHNINIHILQKWRLKPLEAKSQFQLVTYQPLSRKIKYQRFLMSTLLFNYVKAECCENKSRKTEYHIISVLQLFCDACHGQTYYRTTASLPTGCNFQRGSVMADINICS